MNKHELSDRPRRTSFGSILARFGSGILIVGCFIFLPAGTLAFWNGWLFLGTLVSLMSAALVYLYRKAPDLLEERLNAHETENQQKFYQVASLIWSVVAFIIPGLDFRYGWSYVPFWLVILSLAVTIAGYAMFFVVMVQNRYASRTIKLQDGQTVVDSGLYSVVRHPMYLAGSVLFIASALVLGSYYALLWALLLPCLLVYRIRNEERLLVAGLAGYEDYTRRVKYRLVPFVW